LVLLVVVLCVVVVVRGLGLCSFSSSTTRALLLYKGFCYPQWASFSLALSVTISASTFLFRQEFFCLSASISSVLLFLNSTNSCCISVCPSRMATKWTWDNSASFAPTRWTPSWKSLWISLVRYRYGPTVGINSSFKRDSDDQVSKTLQKLSLWLGN